MCDEKDILLDIYDALLIDIVTFKNAKTRMEKIKTNMVSLNNNFFTLKKRKSYVRREKSYVKSTRYLKFIILYKKN